jgi:hypothetical protein
MRSLRLEHRTFNHFRTIYAAREDLCGRIRLIASVYHFTSHFTRHDNLENLKATTSIDFQWVNKRFCVQCRRRNGFGLLLITCEIWVDAVCFGDVLLNFLEEFEGFCWRSDQISTSFVRILESWRRGHWTLASFFGILRSFLLGILTVFYWIFTDF